jgi:hypothetical protein
MRAVPNSCALTTAPTARVRAALHRLRHRAVPPAPLPPGACDRVGHHPPRHVLGAVEELLAGAVRVCVCVRVCSAVHFGRSCMVAICGALPLLLVLARAWHSFL